MVIPIVLRIVRVVKTDCFGYLLNVCFVPDQETPTLRIVVVREIVGVLLFGRSGTILLFARIDAQRNHLEIGSGGAGKNIYT